MTILEVTIAKYTRLRYLIMIDSKSAVGNKKSYSVY
jgi:hypothetical protein